MAEPRNWGRASSLWFEIGTMPSAGPVLLTDDTQTIQWLSDPPSTAAIDHEEQERGAAGEFLFDQDGEQQVPRMTSRTVEPAYWSPVAMVEG